MFPIRHPVGSYVGYFFRRLYIYIYIYVWKLNQTVLELDFRAVKFVFFPRRDLNPYHIYIYIIWKSTPFITGVTTTGIIVAVYFYLPMYVYCCCYAWIFINPFVWKYLLTWVPEFVPIFCTCLNDLCGVQYCQITCLYCFLFLVVMSATISA